MGLRFDKPDAFGSKCRGPRRGDRVSIDQERLTILFDELTAVARCVRLEFKRVSAG